MSEFNNFQKESVDGGYLVVYVNGEKFTPEVRKHQTWDEGDWYSLVDTHSETIRLVEHFGLEAEKHFSIIISVEKEERRGFFGGKRIETIYTFRAGGFQEEFQSDLVYLEK